MAACLTADCKERTIWIAETACRRIAANKAFFTAKQLATFSSQLAATKRSGVGELQSAPAATFTTVVNDRGYDCCGFKKSYCERHIRSVGGHANANLAMFYIEIRL